MATRSTTTGESGPTAMDTSDDRSEVVRVYESSSELAKVVLDMVVIKNCQFGVEALIALERWDDLAKALAGDSSWVPSEGARKVAMTEAESDGDSSFVKVVDCTPFVLGQKVTTEAVGAKGVKGDSKFCKSTIHLEYELSKEMRELQTRKKQASSSQPEEEIPTMEGKDAAMFIYETAYTDGAQSVVKDTIKHLSSCFDHMRKVTNQSTQPTAEEQAPNRPYTPFSTSGCALKSTLVPSEVVQLLTHENAPTSLLKAFLELMDVVREHRQDNAGRARPYIPLKDLQDAFVIGCRTGGSVSNLEVLISAMERLNGAGDAMKTDDVVVSSRLMKESLGLESACVLLKALLMRGSSPTAPNDREVYHKLVLGVVSAYPEVLKQTRYSPKKDDKKWNAFHLACHTSNDVELLQKLMDLFPKGDAKNSVASLATDDSVGFLPIHIACSPSAFVDKPTEEKDDTKKVLPDTAKMVARRLGPNCRPVVADLAVVRMLADCYPNALTVDAAGLPLHRLASTSAKTADATLTPEQASAAAEVLDELLTRAKSAASTWSHKAHDKSHKIAVLPLHVAMAVGAPWELVEKLIDAYPEGASIDDDDSTTGEEEGRRMNAMLYMCTFGRNYNLETVQKIIAKFPHLLRRMGPAYPKDSGLSGDKIVHYGLPLHALCSRDGMLAELSDMIKLLGTEYPGAWAVREDRYGFIPMRSIYKTDSNSDLVEEATKRYPEGIFVRDANGKSLLDLKCKSKNPQEMFAFMRKTLAPGKTEDEDDAWFLAEDSVSQEVRKNAGMRAPAQRLPVHMACANLVPLKFVRFLHQKSPTAFTKQDEDGNLPFHLACAGDMTNPKSDDDVDDDDEDDEEDEDEDDEDEDAMDDGEQRLQRKSSSFAFGSMKGGSRAEQIFSFLLGTGEGGNALHTPNKAGLLPFHVACLNKTSTVATLYMVLRTQPSAVETKTAK